MTELEPYDYPEIFKVVVYNEDKDVSKALGITDARHEEIVDFLETKMNGHITITDILIKVSEFAKHPNELVLMSMYVAVIIESKKSKIK